MRQLRLLMIALGVLGWIMFGAAEYYRKQTYGWYIVASDGWEKALDDLRKMHELMERELTKPREPCEFDYKGDRDAVQKEA